MDIEISNPYDNALLHRVRDLQLMMPYWSKVNTIIRGLHALREGGEFFLPKFPEEQEDSYRFRLTQTKLTNVYRDVLEGLSTKPFEEEITLIKSDENPVPQELRDFVENVDGSGNNITVFASLTFFNGINNAIDWILVDYPEVESDGRPISRAEAARRNLKPFWSHVLGPNILEVRMEKIGGKNVLSYIRILEPSLYFDVYKIREYERIGDTVHWRLHSVNAHAASRDEAVVMERSGILSINVIPMIPFVTGRRDGNTFRFFPALEDAADLQITLYQDESALQFIKTLACFPMLAANGMKPQMQADGKTPVKVATGPMRVLYGLPDNSGNHGEWKYIEPQANSMEFLQKNIVTTKQDLRELGRQPLTSLSTQLTTTTTAIAAGKAKSAVSAWALGLKDALENALAITLMYMKIDYEPEVNVYTGFDNVDGSGADLEELGKARERRDISQETYWSELQRRKVLSPEFRSDEEVQRLLNEIPSEGIDSPLVDENDNNGRNANASL